MVSDSSSTPFPLILMPFLERDGLRVDLMPMQM
jgi:hypothetical protein